MENGGVGQRIRNKLSLGIAALVLGFVLFAQADNSNTLAWAWSVTVEDPQGRIDSGASVYLLIDTAISLEALEAAIAKGNFDPKTALRNFTLKQGTQTVYFKVPYTTEEFNEHGIYALFSATDPLKSKYYSVGYFSAFRDNMGFLPPGYYYDSEANVVPCYCNMSTVSFANAKRTGWYGVLTPTSHPLSIVIVHGTGKPYSAIHGCAL